MAISRAPFDRAHRGHARRLASLAAGVALLFAVVLGCAIGAGELLGLAERPDGSTGPDDSITSWVMSHRTVALTTVARVVAALGSSKVLGPLVAVVAIALVVRGRPFPAALLILAWAGSIGLYDLTKEVVSRPRPPASIALATAHNTSFPSGHATQSLATWATLAAICIALWPRFKVLVPFVVACLVAAIGWSRVYLGVHWTTDVVCGWAIAAAWVEGGSWLARRA
ncbi:MAG: phosphatase PAP2 family protein [Solirubrobacteraceae bacterium]